MSLEQVCLGASLVCLALALVGLTIGLRHAIVEREVLPLRSMFSAAGFGWAALVLVVLGAWRG